MPISLTYIGTNVTIPMKAIEPRDSLGMATDRNNDTQRERRKRATHLCLLPDGISGIGAMIKVVR